jgi:hypothetical protein
MTAFSLYLFHFVSLAMSKINVRADLNHLAVMG